MLAFTVDWDWSLAERAYRQALEVDSADVIAHVSYAQFLAVTGRTRKSTAHCVQAEKLDPLSVIVKCVAGCIYDWNGASDRARATSRKAIALAPDFSIRITWLVLCRPGGDNMKKRLRNLRRHAAWNQVLRRREVSEETMAEPAERLTPEKF